MLLTLLIFLLNLTLGLVDAQGSQTPCNQDILDRTFVTQCGTTVCEMLLEPGKNGERLNEWPKTKDEVIQVVSSRGGERFNVKSHKAEEDYSTYYEMFHANPTMFVDPNTKYQRILGFGTTLTDASCKNVDDLPDEIRDKLIKDYFSTESGIGLNLLKIPIGSGKYSYTNYVLEEPDSKEVELSPYDLNHRVPLIKDALQAAGKFKNRVKLIASSASAPPNYKANNQLVHGGSLRQDRIGDYANYLNNFVAAYRSHELNIWSLILNESPVSVARERDANDKLDYNSMAMSPTDSIMLIRALNEQSSKSSLNKYRLLILGDSRAHVPTWVDTVLKSQDVARNVAGVAYSCNTTDFPTYDNLFYATKRHPSKYLLATQSSIAAPIKLGNWQYAENYGTEIVKNLEFGSVGWIDFNMLLNLDGGPSLSQKFKGEYLSTIIERFIFTIERSISLINTFCISTFSSAQASVMMDARRGVYYRDPMFYAIGHLSRYVKPGSIRVKNYFLVAPFLFEYQSIAFVTPDNYLIVFIMNNNIGPMPVNIGIDKVRKVSVLLDTKSFNTFIFRL